MADSFSKEVRSSIMSKVKSNDNKSTEVRLIKIFKEHSIKGWRRKSKLIGKPDFVFPRAKVAVFVDGCFWHGCSEHCRIPETNVDYWKSKIDANKNRDIAVNQQLVDNGWKVVRFWEHELKKMNYICKLQILQFYILN